MKQKWMPYEVEDGFLVVTLDEQAKPTRKICKCGGNKKTAAKNASNIVAALNEFDRLQAQNARLLEALREIQSEIPKNPKFALTAIIKEIIDAVLAEAENQPPTP